MTVLLASSFFVFGFVLRAVRLWVVLHRTRSAFLYVLLALCVSAVVSFLTGFVWLGESLKWVFLALIARQAWVSVGFSLVYTRLFDFILFSLAWLFLNRTFGGTEFGLLLSSLIVFFILVGFVLLPTLIQRLRHYVFSSVSSSRALVLLKGFNRFQFEFEQLRLTRPYLLFTMAVLTVGIWCCEVLSVIFMFQVESFESLPQVVLQVLMEHFSTLVSSLHRDLEMLPQLPLNGLWNSVMIKLTVILTLGMIVWKGVKRLWRS